MEKEERNSSRSEDEEDQGKAEEDEEVKTAAHILCLIHKSKLDPKSAEELRELVAKHTSIHDRSATMESQDKKKKNSMKKQHTVSDSYRRHDNNTKRSNSRSATTNNIPLPPPLEHLQGLVGRWSKPFSRVLTPTDVRDHFNRLIIAPPNYKEFVMPLLTEEDSIDEGIQVTTYDESGKEYSMMLKIWCGKYYVLATKGWKQFCRDQNLISCETHKDVITLWMFRHAETHNLCCAITKG